MENQALRVIVGTVAGLYEFGTRARLDLDPLAGQEITALAREDGRLWVLSEGRRLQRSTDRGSWEMVATVEGPPGASILPSPAGVFLGTEQARLLKLDAGTLRPVESFERVEGREAWYTPWGDPADVRSMAADAAGVLYVNVHVGGVARSGDGGASWRPILDIETDVHQVIAHPVQPGLVLVAAAAGFGMTVDGGESWRFENAGLHAHYLRAVAIAGPTVLISASTGHRGRRSALYRKPLDGGGEFERCWEGLPTWFDANIDTGCLAAVDDLAAFGTEDGSIFVSTDGGRRWEPLAKGLPAVRCLTLD